MSVFFAYVLKPFIVVAVLFIAYLIGWPIRKWLDRKLTSAKRREKLLTRI